MPSIFQMLPMITSQNFGKQELERLPEPASVTSDVDNVAQYDRVMETKLAISYAIAIETIYRARTTPFGGRALDIASGPGHLSINLAKELKLDQLVGIDLSPPMVEVASKNAKEQGVENVRFETGDATDLDAFAEAEFDLTTMMDAVHHMPSLNLVTEVLREMDRVTRSDGLVVVMDLVRLRSRTLTENYVQSLAHDYTERGLPHFLDDFRNSMYAAWTPSELSSAVPPGTRRKWSIVVPRGLPFAQFLIGYPKDRSSVFFKRKRLWKSDNVPVAAADRADYRMAHLTMAGASIRPVR